MNRRPKKRSMKDEVVEHVTATIISALEAGEREPMMAYLRDLGEVVRRESDSREVVQVIASARQVLRCERDWTGGRAVLAHLIA